MLTSGGSPASPSPRSVPAARPRAPREPEREPSSDPEKGTGPAAFVTNVGESNSSREPTAAELAVMVEEAAAAERDPLGEETLDDPVRLYLREIGKVRLLKIGRAHV